MRRILLTAVGFFVVLGASGLAHHDYESFERDKIVTIDGAIEHIVYGNPHVVVTVKTADATVYTVVWSTPNSLLRRYGMQSTTLKLGDRVVVSGSPHRDRSLRTVSLVTEVRRPADGKVWSEPRLSNPAR
jgi:hypothetical protein